MPSRRTFAGRLDARLRGRPTNAVLREVRCSRTALHYWRTGERTPSVGDLPRLAKAAGVSIDWLVTGKGPQDVRGKWSCVNRDLYLIDGLDVNQSFSDAEMRLARREFEKALGKELLERYGRLSENVRIVFGSLFVRIMFAAETRNDERRHNPRWRGKVAARALRHCAQRAAEISAPGPNAGFDDKPYSTDSWLAAIAEEMREWRNGRLHRPEWFN